jgi:hypothetical protein
MRAPSFVLMSVIAMWLTACATVRAPESLSTAPIARVAMRSDDHGLHAELRPRTSDGRATPITWCAVPCTLLSVPGPAELTVSKGSEVSSRSVILANGDQTMRIRSGNRIARGAGWASLGASFVALSIFGVTYSTMVKFNEDQPQPVPATGGASSGNDASSGESGFKNAWAGPVVVVSITAVIPLLVTGLLLLDYGTAGVTFE